MKDSIDSYSFTDEEIMEAINNGSSDKFILRSVGNGKSFRGYVILDSKYNVRIADYIYSHAQNKFELRKRPGYEQELRAQARDDAKYRRGNERAEKYSLIRAKLNKRLGGNSINKIARFTHRDTELVDTKIISDITLRNCDYRLCVAYLNYSFKKMDEYIDNEEKGTKRGLAIGDAELLKRVRENLRVGYANAAFASSYDVEDYRAMDGMEKQVEYAIDRVRRNTLNFEAEMLKTFPKAVSFVNSPVKKAIILPIVNDSGKDVDRVYIPDSVANYPENGVPTDAISREGILYTPIMDTPRQEDLKPKM